MHAPIRTVIFDFEGTLVDFQWRLAEAEAELRAAFAQQGYAVEGNYARMWNLAADRATAPDRIDALRRALYPVYDRWDGDALTRWSARAGAAALLQRLAERGVAAALVSNIGRTALDAALVRFGLRDRLRRVVSRDDVTRLKPDPQGVGDRIGGDEHAAGPGAVRRRQPGRRARGARRRPARGDHPRRRGARSRLRRRAARLADHPPRRGRRTDLIAPPPAQR
ncbi:MAG TPA: HAD hydrolase-like protein, partial [Rubrivivax sp.]|nr:HAD hydrolase-like protein [Rubrivivax sp.]